MNRPSLSVQSPSTLSSSSSDRQAAMYSSSSGVPCGETSTPWISCWSFGVSGAFRCGVAPPLADSSVGPPVGGASASADSAAWSGAELSPGAETFAESPHCPATNHTATTARRIRTGHRVFRVIRYPCRCVVRLRSSPKDSTGPTEARAEDRPPVTNGGAGDSPCSEWCSAPTACPSSRRVC